MQTYTHINIAQKSSKYKTGSITNAFIPQGVI